MWHPKIYLRMDGPKEMALLLLNGKKKEMDILYLLKREKDANKILSLMSSIELHLYANRCY